MSEIKIIENFSPQEIITELRARDKAKREENEAVIQRKSELDGIDDEILYEYARSEQEVLYGVDDRKDLFEVSSAKIHNDADSVVALFREDDLVDNGDGTSTLLTQKFQKAYNLCSREPFVQQPIGAFCSGFLVAPQVIATAGHCVKNDNLAGVRLVFGFRMIDEQNAQTTIPNSDIYSCSEIIGREKVDTGADWALVKLDRPVEDRPIVSIRLDGKIPLQTSLHVIGHPCGLPLKYADNATIKDNDLDTHFSSNLDTYGGNSGSPVFNSETHQVEGILVRGNRDFVPVNNCMVSVVCPADIDHCRGEDCTRTTVFAAYLDENDLI